MGSNDVGREAYHRPVLLREILGFLRPEQLRLLIDGTVGEGGHIEAFLEEMPPESTAAGMDRDGEIIKIAAKRVERYGNQARLFVGSYRDMAEVVEKVGIGPANGILLDLGLSSYHLGEPRGFSFMEDSELDMRFDREEETSTACEMVNSLPEEELMELLREFGEERKAHRIARAIVSARKVSRIESGTELSNIVAKAAGRSGRINPATLTFQALRIAVNGELDHVREALEVIPEQLAPGGRVAIVSYHSMEDRIVKRAMLSWEESGSCVRLTKKPVTPSDEEVRENPRSRSAKLRVAERR